MLYKPFRWFFSVRSLRRFYPPYILLPKSYFVFQIQLWWIHDEKIKIFIIYITRVVCCWLCWGWLTEYTAQACTKHATLIIIIISVGLPPPPSIPHDKQLKKMNEWMNIQECMMTQMMERQGYLYTVLMFIQYFIVLPECLFVLWRCWEAHDKLNEVQKVELMLSVSAEASPLSWITHNSLAALLYSLSIH